MKNVGQIGFDFGDDGQAYRLDADGTWSPLARVFADHAARMSAAQAALAKLNGIPQVVFATVLEAQIHEYKRQVKHCQYDERPTDAHTLWGCGVKLSGAECESIIAHCVANAGTCGDGVEYKVRQSRSSWSSSVDLEAGMFAPGVGSVVVGKFKHADEWNYSVSFNLAERDSHFLANYMDDVDYAYCSEAVWGPAYSAQLIAEAHTKIPSVRTFKYGGREYVNTGACHGRNHYSQCKAWSIVSAEEWKGDTFTYAEITAAWDRGAAERGDDRGLLVRVRGVLCVLEKPLIVYDDQPRELILSTDDGEEEEIEDFNEIEGQSDFEAEDEMEMEYS